ncbi:MAG TPA: hypothetical protein QF572_17590 [Vicinamibacterales bacterium]|jgi:uncharacterized membrane protein|nr:hypothetical protein [Vicinamibacterales bacterium]
MTKFSKYTYHIIFVTLLVLSVVPRVSIYFTSEDWRQDVNDLNPDIYYHWLESERIANGQNPYTRVLQADGIHNDKYPGYLPLLYFTGAGLIFLGIDDFFSYFSIIKIVIILADMLAAFLIYYPSTKIGRQGLGLFGAAVWLLNRWTLYSNEHATFDTAIVALLVASLFFLYKRPKVSFLLYGLSLAFKQFGIFLFPLFLFRAKSIRNIWNTSFYVWIVPTVISIPFLVLNAEAFIRSLTYDGIRIAPDHGVHGFPVHPLFELVGSTGVVSRLPTVGVLVALYYVIFKYQLNRYLASFLLFLTFVCFNPVVFNQYVPYVIPFIFLYALEEEREYFVSTS